MARVGGAVDSAAFGIPIVKGGTGLLVFLAWTRRVEAWRHNDGIERSTSIALLANTRKQPETYVMYLPTSSVGESTVFAAHVTKTGGLRPRPTTFVDLLHFQLWSSYTYIGGGSSR